MKNIYITAVFSWLFLSLPGIVLKAQEINSTGDVEQRTDSISFGMNEGKGIDLPFRTSDAEMTTGAIWTISPEEIMSYDNIQDVSEALYGRVPGMRGTNIREFGEALVIIDGVPRPLASVTLQEIEQITVLRDISATILYGVQASNGVIMVKTKRGPTTGRKISAWAEYGMDRPISYPKFLNSADYMELYNEARVNDGLPEQYTLEEIESTRAGTNPLWDSDTDYYGSVFLNNSRPVSRGAVDFAGGNENAQYYVNAGFKHSGSLLKVGKGSNERANRLNIRSNVNFRINDFIKSHLDIAAVYDNQKTANGNFWGNASTLRPNLFPLLIDTSLVSVPGANLIEGRYMVGGTSQFRDNVYGDLYFGGYSNNSNTTAQFTNGIDFDLRSITQGLTLKVLGSFDFRKRYREYQNNEYAIYALSLDGGDNVVAEKFGAEKVSGTQALDNTLIQRVFGFNAVLNYARVFNEKHAVSASAVGFMNRVRQTDPNILYDDKYTHLGLNLNYVYDRKYVVDFSSALAHSVKLPEHNRNAFSPALALGWIVSNEDFLKSNAVLDFLKLRASAGIMNTDFAIAESYYYQDLFANGDEGSYPWNDGVKSNQKTTFQNVGNNDLSFERKLDLNFGVEAGLFNRSLWLDVNVFRNNYADKVLKRTANINDYLGGFAPYLNYGEDRYTGVEIGALWSKPLTDDFHLDIGINATYVHTEVVTTDELPYENEYQYRAGRPVNAIFGLQALGLFKDDADIDAHAEQMLGEVNPGDIKYADQNNDGVVNDNDMLMIGNSIPTFSGGLNVRLSYKGLSLFAIATAIEGSDRMYNSPYYWVYGDRKYSEEVLNRWTPQTAATATYPRLTSESSSNNFRGSTFWLYDDSRVTLDRVQLSYSFPKSIASALRVSDLNFYVRGNYLATFSKNRERMELSIGSEPQVRSYAVGIKARFF